MSCVQGHCTLLGSCFCSIINTCMIGNHDMKYKQIKWRDNNGVCIKKSNMSQTFQRKEVEQKPRKRNSPLLPYVYDPSFLQPWSSRKHLLFRKLLRLQCLLTKHLFLNKEKHVPRKIKVSQRFIRGENNMEVLFKKKAGPLNCWCEQIYDTHCLLTR